MSLPLICQTGRHRRHHLHQQICLHFMTTHHHNGHCQDEATAEQKCDSSREKCRQHRHVYEVDMPEYKSRSGDDSQWPPLSKCEEQADCKYFTLYKENLAKDCHLVHIHIHYHHKHKKQETRPRTKFRSDLTSAPLVRDSGTFVFFTEDVSFSMSLALGYYDDDVDDKMVVCT